MANAVEEGLNYLGALVDSSHGDQSTYGDAYVATSDSESSAEKIDEVSLPSYKKDESFFTTAFTFTLPISPASPAQGSRQL